MRAFLLIGVLLVLPLSFEVKPCSKPILAPLVIDLTQEDNNERQGQDGAGRGGEQSHQRQVQIVGQALVVYCIL